MFDDVVTVSFGFSGHKSREEAAQALKNGDKESVMRMTIQVIIHSW